MVDQIIHPPVGEIIAVDVSPERYMRDYAHERCEWIRGYVIKMSPVSYAHDELSGYLYLLLKAYFALNPLGVIKREPFVMQVDTTQSRREPDLQIILHTNPGQLTETAMIGPADICVEVVSAESVTRDYGEKFLEYEQGGVGEYWLIDPIRAEAFFYRLGDDGHYDLQRADENGYYRSTRLPKLSLYVPTLWQSDLPGFFEIAQAVQAMFVDKP